jgi:hypothetical protein
VTPSTGASGDDVLSNGLPIPEPVLPEVNPNPKASEAFFDVLITLAASPSNFRVQSYLNIQACSKFTRMVEDMMELYENEENRIELHPDLVCEGIYAAAKFTDGKWYRVRVETVISRDPMEVMCYFVDYGDLHLLDLKQIQPLFSQFRVLPKQAIKASLATVEPLDGDWDVLACYEFNKMVESKAFVSTVFGVRRVEGQEPVLQLSLCDTSGESDVFVEQLLVDKKYAKRRSPL